MSIEKPDQYTAPVFYPEENYKIVKYLDITKFLSLIQTESIFFCRLDKFEDKFEGTLPITSLKYLEGWYRQMYHSGQLHSNNIEESIQKALITQKKAEESFKKIVCISCWNKNMQESYALWKIYSDINKGIMITSNIDNLISSLENTSEKIQLSEVRYINHKTDFIDVNNLNYPIIHKNTAYHFEEEVRLIHQVEAGNGLLYDWSDEKNSNGKYIDIDLNILIDEIILSPYAPEWFFDIIKDLLEKYNLKKTIKFSDLK